MHTHRAHQRKWKKSGQNRPIRSDPRPQIKCRIPPRMKDRVMLFNWVSEMGGIGETNLGVAYWRKQIKEIKDRVKLFKRVTEMGGIGETNLGVAYWPKQFMKIKYLEMRLMGEILKEILTLVKDRVLGDEKNLLIIPITGMGGIGQTTLTESVYEGHLPDSSAKTKTAAKESMVGVDEDLTQIKDRVLGDEKNLQIIPITEMGGIGQTTLAKSFYEDHLPQSKSKTKTADKESMVGVDEDLTQIKDRVTGDEKNLQIIPITGMGGIGKTTLAKSVYEDQMIVDYFDTRHFVTVSQEYNVQHILGRILSVEGSNAEFFIELVYKSLKDRRYLIVMDDMWHAEVWDKVRRAFPDDHNGSRVIITTRLSEVALNIDSDSQLHRMRLLDENQSWALFCRKAFADQCPPSHMEEIGKSIARNCKGLPLAIVVMAGLLRGKTIEYWENIAENVNVASTVNDDDRYLGIFSLSYSNLPHQLKSCFLYMGVFPGDYEIPVKKLIKLWVADGFLEPVETKSLEELAEEYLEDLVERSLVMIMRKRSNGRIRFCKIHDVLRDLSIRKGREERFLQHFIKEDRTFSKLVEGQHRLGIYTYDPNFLKTNIHNSPIHSLLYFASKTNQLSSFASQFKSLRVVDKLLVNTKIFPDKIFQLVNLRYLAFTYDHRGKCVISPSISKLQNLQTLIIKRGDLPTDYMCRVVLPLEIWKMPQLRHLVLMRNTFLPFPYRNGIGGTYPVLENLQTLSNVMNFKFTKEVVEGFPNLKKLRLQYDSIEPKQWAKFGLGNLVYLQELEELNFHFHAGSAPLDSKTLATNLAFPQKLRKLTLTCSEIPWEKMSMVGSLPNLEVLKLMEDSFVGEEWEPTEGEFLVLKYLDIENIDLSEWRVESDHFPRFERLIIRWCYNLKEVPSSVGDIPTLESLTMQSCNVEAEDSVRRIQKEQQGLGNYALQVEVQTIFLSKREETTSEQPEPE